MVLQSDLKQEVSGDRSTLRSITSLKQCEKWSPDSTYLIVYANFSLETEVYNQNYKQ